MAKAEMTRRGFLKALGLSAACGAAGRVACARPAAGEKAPPNIILIMADDMGYSDLGCYGSEIATPNLDKLAADGLRFSQFYNGARCCPTRASLLTGLYAHQAGVGAMVGGPGPGPYQGYLNDTCVTLAEGLKGAGYRTYMSGKWHVGESEKHWPVKRGFDRYYGLISGGMNYWDIDKPKAKGVKRRYAIDDKAHRPPNKDFYVTDAFSDNAVKFIDEHTRRAAISESGRFPPFFLYLAYTAPHWPLHAWPADIAKYQGKYTAGWEALRRSRHKRQIELGLLDAKWKLSPPDPAAADWEKLSPEQKDLMDLKMAIYAAQIDRMDQGIGKVLEALDRTDRADNTLVMFLADNGGCAETGALGFDNRRGKGGKPGGPDSYMSYGLSWANASNTPFRFHKKWIHEGGISTPFIARWPDVIKPPKAPASRGAITHQVGHIIDVMATCLDAARAPYPKTYRTRPITPTPGRSLLPIFQGKTREPHEAIFWEHYGNRGVRAGDWKLVATARSQWSLYNMQSDRSELTDLSQKHPEKAAALLTQWTAWAKKCGVKTKAKK